MTSCSLAREQLPPKTRGLFTISQAHVGIFKVQGTNLVRKSEPKTTSCRYSRIFREDKAEKNVVSKDYLHH